MEGPQAIKYNPVLEAIDALNSLDDVLNGNLAHEDVQPLTMSEYVTVLNAKATAWSLLASVTGGAVINIGDRPEDGGEEEEPSALEAQAKAAFR